MTEYDKFQLQSIRFIYLNIATSHIKMYVHMLVSYVDQIFINMH